MPNDRLTGPMLKIDRANRHIEELRLTIVAWHESGAHRVVVEDDHQAGQRRYTLNLTQPIPPKIGLIVGDIAHNLRSALDHLAWQLVDAYPGGRAPGHDTAFPVRRKPTKPSAAETHQLVYSKLIGADPKVIDAVELMGAYKGGPGHPIWLVDHLDIVDKHRLVVVTTVTNEYIGFDFAAIHRAVTEAELREARAMGDQEKIDRLTRVAAMPPTVLNLTPATRKMNDGDLIFTEPLESNTDPSIAFGVGLDDPDFADEEPLIPLLPNLSKSIRETIEAFVAYL